MPKLRRVVFLLSLSCLGAGGAHAAEWSKTLGGALHTAGEDVAESVQPTPDGGYVVVGHTQSFGVSGGEPAFPADNAWVVKLNADGNVEWQKTYGSTGYDLAFSVRSTLDGGYIVAGQTQLPGSTGAAAWVFKLDSIGNVIWQMASGNTSAAFERAQSVEPTADGGYVVVGYSQTFGAGSNDAWVFRLDASGNLLWQKTYGGKGLDVANAVQPTADGGYVVAGATTSFSDNNEEEGWVFRLDSIGNVLWQKAYGGGPGTFGGVGSVHQTQDGAFIVAGETRAFGAGGGDAWVFKLDGAGNIIWQKTYGGAGEEGADSIYPTPGGGYIVAGSSTSFGAPNYAGWVFKIDATGNIIWQRTYGGTNGAFLRSARPTADGGYILVGETASFGADGFDAWILKLGADGTITGCPIMGESNATAADGNAAALTSLASVAASNAVFASTAVTPVASTTVPRQQCLFSGAHLFSATPPAINIPTLSEWTLVALSIMLTGIGFLYRRPLL